MVRKEINRDRFFTRALGKIDYLAAGCASLALHIRPLLFLPPEKALNEVGLDEWNHRINSFSGFRDNKRPSDYF